MYWFTKEWWKYLFCNIDKEQNFFTTVWCRMRGHKCGIVFYNPGGLEPDMSCKNCGDDLG